MARISTVDCRNCWPFLMSIPCERNEQISSLTGYTGLTGKDTNFSGIGESDHISIAGYGSVESRRSFLHLCPCV